MVVTRWVTKCFSVWKSRLVLSSMSVWFMNGHFPNPNNITPARLSYSANSSCESEFVFGAWYLGSNPSAFTSALGVITTNILSTMYRRLHREDRKYKLCGNAMKTMSSLTLLALKFLLSHYLECWESLQLAFKWTPTASSVLQSPIKTLKILRQEYLCQVWGGDHL